MTVKTVKITDSKDYPVMLTDRAVIAIKEVMSADEIECDGLRVGVRGGGCAGFKFVLDFSEAQENDYVMDFDGVLVFIDPVSATHLEGTTVDYVAGLLASGFKFDNPHAKQTCGCGASFA